MQIGRFSPYCEQNHRNHFEQKFDFLCFNKLLTERIVSKDCVIAFDPCYIPKSGKQTYGRGKFWSCSGKAAKWGLDICGFALVDVENKTAFHFNALLTAVYLAKFDWLSDKSGERLPFSSVNRLLPSSACIFNCPIFSDSSLTSFFNFAFKSFQYLRGLSVPVSASITSIIEKYHFSCSLSHKERFFLFSKIFMSFIALNIIFFFHNQDKNTFLLC